MTIFGDNVKQPEQRLENIEDALRILVPKWKMFQEFFTLFSEQMNLNSAGCIVEIIV